MKKLTAFLNNLKYTNKIMLIYIVCVLVPTITISVFYYFITANKINNERQKDLKYSISIANERINNYFNEAININNSMLTDKQLYSDLATKGEDKYEYITIAQKYDRYVQPYIIRNSVSAIGIYTNNTSLYNSEALHQLTEKTKQSNWYQKFLSNKNDTMMYIYKDEHDKNVLTIVSYLNEYYNTQKEKDILKIDLNLNQINDILNTQSVVGSLLLIDGEDRIIAMPDTYREKADAKYKIGEKLDTDSLDNFKVHLDIINSYKIVGLLNENSAAGFFGLETVLFIVLILFFAVISTGLILFTTKIIVKKLNQLTECTVKLQHHSFELVDDSDVGKDEIGILTIGFNQAIIRIQELINEVYKQRILKEQSEKEKNKAYLIALNNQINPHVIFNMLESVRMKSIIKDERETAKVIKDVSQMFRYILKWDNDMIMLKSEIEFITHYLDIQKYRYEDEIEFVIDVDESVCECEIPKMLIQVFVENSFAHGFCDKIGNKYVKVTAKPDGAYLVITVFDNGTGIEKKLINKILSDDEVIKENGHNSVGIKNVCRRLELSYQDDYSLSIESVIEESTLVTIKIPRKGD